MLTLESKFSEFIELCRKAGACAEPGEAIPVMEEANKGNGMSADGTCEEGFALYLKNEKFPSGWALWVIEKLGKDLDEDCRRYFVDKISEPIDAVNILLKCEFLTTAEDNLLKAKYEGKLPTVDKELATGVVVLAKDKVKP